MSENMDTSKIIKAGRQQVKNVSLAIATLFTMSSCSESIFQDAQSLQADGYKQISSHTVETTNRYNGTKDTITIASEKRYAGLSGADGKYVRQTLEEEYEIFLEGEAALGEVVAVDREKNSQVTFYISKEGYVFYDGESNVAEDILHKIDKIIIDRGSNTISQTITK